MLCPGAGRVVNFFYLFVWLFGLLFELNIVKSSAAYK